MFRESHEGPGNCARHHNADDDGIQFVRRVQVPALAEGAWLKRLSMGNNSTRGASPLIAWAGLAAAVRAKLPHVWRE